MSMAASIAAMQAITMENITAQLASAQMSLQTSLAQAIGDLMKKGGTNVEAAANH